MEPDGHAGQPQQDWGSAVLRDLGLVPDPPSPAAAPPAPPAAAAQAPARNGEAPAPPPAEQPAAADRDAPAAEQPGPVVVAAAEMPAAAVGEAQAPPAPAPRAPRPAELDPERFTRARHHREPPGRQAVRRVRQVLGVGASREVREATARAERLRQPVTTIRRIAVLGARGGAGKTAVATLLATTLAASRPDRVLAVDAAPELSSLALVAGASSPRSLAAFGRAAPTLRTFEDAEPHLGRGDGGPWLLTGPDDQDPGGPLDLPAYQAAVAALSRFFAVMVTDCGPDPAGPLNLGILGDAHAVALVTPATVDGVVSAHRALRRLRETRAAGLVPRTVLVLTAHTPHTDGVDLKRATRSLASQGVRVARLPYDRHLAAGARLRPHLLGQRTRTATIGLAADLLTFAVSDRGAW